jgi:hypothetical protein
LSSFRTAANWMTDRAFSVVQAAVLTVVLILAVLIPIVIVMGVHDAITGRNEPGVHEKPLNPGHPSTGGRMCVERSSGANIRCAAERAERC